jgi:O-methyltransferase
MALLHFAWNAITVESRRLTSRARRLRLMPLYEKYRSFTMIPRSNYVTNLMLAREVRGVPGSVVECGVWRGGMSAGLAEMLGPSRTYYLFDSFEGLPPANADVDGAAGVLYQRNEVSLHYHDNCRADIGFATTAMRMSGATSVHVVKGWFNDTLPSFPADQPIALLRLDADWYDSTLACLENLGKYVVPGGLIVMDDYFTWDGCARAVHDYLSGHHLPFRIAQARGDVAYIRVGKLE